METPGDTSADTPLMEGANHTNSESNSNNDVTQSQPPDGGFWAWLVLVSCFLVNGIIFGIINTFGILFVQLKIDLDEAGVEDAATKCGNVTTLLLSYISIFATGNNRIIFTVYKTLLSVRHYFDKSS